MPTRRRPVVTKILGIAHRGDSVRSASGHTVFQTCEIRSNPDRQLRATIHRQRRRWPPSANFSRSPLNHDTPLSQLTPIQIVIPPGTSVPPPTIALTLEINGTNLLTSPSYSGDSIRLGGLDGPAHVVSTEHQHGLERISVVPCIKYIRHPADLLPASVAQFPHFYFSSSVAKSEKDCSVSGQRAREFSRSGCNSPLPRRKRTRDRLATVTPIDSEVPSVHGPDFAAHLQLRHPQDAGIGKVHLPVLIFCSRPSTA